jgi:diacylglycerol O-acyltransferase / wax synthase
MAPELERLAAVDAANLAIDRPGQVNVFLLAGLLAPGGFLAAERGVDMDLLRAALRDRVPSIPALCRRLVTSGRRHSWEAAFPDLEQHIRLVEPVDGRDGLERLCAALMVAPLPRHRPLWEILVVPGAGEPGAGIVLRIHHAAADGMAAVAIAQRLLEPSGQGRKPPRDQEQRGPKASARTSAPAAVDRTRTSLRRALQMVRGGSIPRTVLLGERSAHRGIALLDVDLDALAGRARERGATVNDALLAGVAAGVEAALAAAGETIPASLPVSVPVALPRRGAAGNQVGVMLVDLPLAGCDPDERLRRIAALTREEKVRARGRGTLELMRGPIGARILDRLARSQRLVAAFVTDVRGPEDSLNLAGAPLVAAWPVAVLAGNVRLGIAALSYRGTLSCGIHFDAEHVPGAAFAHAMGAEIERLAG